MRDELVFFLDELASVAQPTRTGSFPFRRTSKNNRRGPKERAALEECGLSETPQVARQPRHSVEGILSASS